ncbi:hypothetical protein [Dactylosporangium sp. NPDC051541]|uniref:hypothetical protein n=1 Tax=Dactylosporangium sp. NPDC051541 TaxID=3363977 RepID=UPI00378F4E72
MTDLDRVVADSLARAADDDVHVERLLAGARADGTRRRRRRLLVIAGSMASVTAAAGSTLAVAASLLPWAPQQPAGPPLSAPTSAPTPTPASANGSAQPTAAAPVLLERFPPMPVVPGAVTPESVGDPGELHIGLATPPFPIRTGQFHTSRDGEWMILQGATNGGRQVRVDLARTTNGFDPVPGAKQDVTVAGRPGQFARDEQFARSTVRWQLTNGLWAQATGPFDQPGLLAFADGVRFDRAYRCSAPIRLPAARAAGGIVDSCSMTFQENYVLSAGITVRLGQSYAGFSFERQALDEDRFKDALVGGVPARIVEGAGDGGTKTLQIDRQFGPGGLSVIAEGGYDGAEVRHLAAVADFVTIEPGNWPADPLA